MQLIEAANAAAGASAAKGQRGVSGVHLVSKYEIGIDIKAMLNLADTPVARGDDAHIAVEVADLPPNADVESCLIDLYTSEADSAPSPQTVGVNITKKGDAGASGNFSVEVAQAAVPSNVRVMLGEELIWTTGGPLTELSYSLPDASAALNTYLDKQTEATAPLKTLPFVVQSDSAGKVGLHITTLNFSQIKTQSWPNPLDSTLRSDRTTDVGFGAIVRLPLDPLIDIPAAAVKLKAISLDMDGKFDADRLLAQVESHDGREFATVSNDYSIAQAFTLNGRQPGMLHSPVTCTGVAASVSAAEAAELYAEIQADESGVPAAGVPLAKGTVSVVPAKADANTPPWALVKFTSAVPLDVDAVYWLVLKAVQGAMELALVDFVPESEAAQPFMRRRMCVSRASLVWKDFARDDAIARVALAGIVYVPAKDDQTAAAQVVMSGAPQSDHAILAAVDPVAKPQTFSYKTGDADWRQTSLELRAYAAGTLHVANVIQRFRVA